MFCRAANTTVDHFTEAIHFLLELWSVELYAYAMLAVLCYAIVVECILNTANVYACNAEYLCAKKLHRRYFIAGLLCS